MNILYLTIAPKISQKMTKDLSDEFVKNGHSVFLVCPCDSNNSVSKKFEIFEGINYLFVRSGNIVGKISILKKVVNFLSIDFTYKKAIKSALKGIHIDLVLYSTPPITLVNTIKWVKRKYSALTYLMLKDIFPQNAVDIGMLRNYGLTKCIYSFFRKKEKKMYLCSDYIGCMSEANRQYLIKNNPYLNSNFIGLCYNSYKKISNRCIDINAKRKEYGLPEDKTIFLYGGNLGKPQGLSFFIEVLKSNIDNNDIFFFICGNGNDQNKLIEYIDDYKPANVKFINAVSTTEYDELMQACDVGLVFLDYNFTIPNYPSRILSIMQNGRPILAATDNVTDIRQLIQENKLGWWCPSNDVKRFNTLIEGIKENHQERIEYGMNSLVYYTSNFVPEITYDQIINLIGGGKKANG